MSGNQTFLSSQHGFKFVGFYLTHAPGTPDMTWIRRRQFLADRSWGFLPIYLGSQAEAPAATDGTTHGQEAVRLMSTAGFPPNTVVYLDIEQPKLPGKFGSYLRAWMGAVRAGGFYPGVYGSYTMAPWLTRLTSAVWTVELPISKLQALTDAVGEVAVTGALSTANGLEQLGAAVEPSAFEGLQMAYDPQVDPHGIIRPSCIATQYLWYQSFSGLPPLDPGVGNVFDLDSSLVADPSNPEQIRHALGLAKLIA
jgi:Domain of unknown function (DUF1906)